ncbi:23S ribosomal RNA methyltransferase Erm [Clostridium sp. D2Q-14]|uniref:23S ribosomal RNA methyltransferase Erm n=1 Tax=Anaeromonas gelatinilytica TaxID=2683194 RepID=UPI00193BF035|nr:23S ribosomal RNA methyltransferase Erm [Anaeromonas gelatinilytica]MBS4536288.1 23S ribosomal RNA methyltransferase Erm [Anaeromonas gelatinilytica]
MKRKLKYTQNFLKSDRLVEKLIKTSNIDSDDIVFEIGPGKGIITRQLSKLCSKVIAIEYDKKLYENLKICLSSYDNVELVFGDFLNYKLPYKEKYKIFSSIPYNITAQILSKITSRDNPPEETYLIIQKEAAQKYAGFPYNNECLRSLMIKPYFELSIVYGLKKTDFIPVPNVDSVLLKIKKRQEYLINREYLIEYSDFISYIFSQQGKDLKKRLKKIFTHKQFKKLSQQFKFGISARPTEIKLEQWIGLFEYYIKGVSIEKKQLVKGATNKLISQQKKIDKRHRSVISN